MSSTDIATNDKIVLNFSWKGPNVWKGGCSRGGLDVRVVDLVFKDAKTEISVHLPENINPEAAQKLSFTCCKYAKETHPESLRVTIEQIRNLTIRAGFFEKGGFTGPRVMNSSTGRITQQQTIRRSDREIRLEIPKELEIGQIYTLIITSEDLSLSASLLKAAQVIEDTRNPSK